MISINRNCAFVAKLLDELPLFFVFLLSVTSCLMDVNAGASVEVLVDFFLTNGLKSTMGNPTATSLQP